MSEKSKLMSVSREKDVAWVMMIMMFCIAITGWTLPWISCPALSQPYYSTRVNAADIDSRVKQLDETTRQQQEGEGEKSKAGFWEEFDVRFYLAIFMVRIMVTMTVSHQDVPTRRTSLQWAKLKVEYYHHVVEQHTSISQWYAYQCKSDQSNLTLRI